MVSYEGVIGKIDERLADDVHCAELGMSSTAFENKAPSSNARAATADSTASRVAPPSF